MHLQHLANQTKPQLDVSYPQINWCQFDDDCEVGYTTMAEEDISTVYAHLNVPHIVRA